MIKGMQRELLYLLKRKWDLCLVTLAPFFIIVIFGSMFYQGKPSHLPIAIIDQDQSELSRNIDRYVSLNHTLSVELRTTQNSEAEQQLNQNKIWGYITIPAGAEQRFVQGKDAEISIAYNQSYFSVGNSISSAMLVSTLSALGNFAGKNYLDNSLPAIEAPTPNIKISALYNPNLNYELYLEPYMVIAILHLLLCCCIAFAVGQEFKFHSVQDWLQQSSTRHSVVISLLSKNLTYVLIFSFWTWIWMFWLIEIRGWFVQGQLWMILAGQFLLYCAYAFISSTVVLATHDLARTFGFLAVYGGSSLSFAGVTLPLNNAPIFTQFWANIIPYTPYAKLQTEQWVIGTPVSISLIPLGILFIYAIFYFTTSTLLLKKYLRGVAQ